MKCGFDHIAGNVEMQRVDKACAAFYEVASMVINTDHDLLKMMNRIKEIQIEFTSKETSPDIIEEDGSIPNQETNILDPKVARSKGRPPFKRTTSKADQIVKKIAKKRIQIRSKKSGKDQGQKEVILRSVYS
jgi:hypothetical protein